MGVPSSSSSAAAAAATAITAISLALTFPWLFATSNADSPPARPYANHTVVWFFDAASNSSAVNYSTWASSQNFFLGDFLIFDTDSNNTVIQTFNATTYALCDFSDDNGNDTTFYYDGSGEPTVNMTVAVPLTEEGTNYFFSAADGGVECLQGMRFEITVDPHHRRRGEGRGAGPTSTCAVAGFVWRFCFLGVDVRTSKICELGILNYRAKRVLWIALRHLEVIETHSGRTRDM
ncbi:hypothetical protein ZIOFF_029754 [Zingiber officinale]|uniref:Phytocyanin domain-containing protein n=1 Tax=Zingiber officinale TaxID=94328 RepID=A0A8J5LEM2_ZINOF|nr:hypothetical protein ZIOFF_029754 [Zingiber officinale]